jgi:hypothetical protein
VASRPGKVESRRGARWVETRVSGRVLAEHIKQMVAGYVEHGAGALWLVDASETESYDPAAIREAVDSFARLGNDHGLERLVPLITQSGVRMGASVVAMSLRAAGARVQVDVVGERAAWEKKGR